MKRFVPPYVITTWWLYLDYSGPHFRKEFSGIGRCSPRAEFNNCYSG